MVIKLTAGITPIHAILHREFPHLKQFFNARHPLPSAKSHLHVPTCQKCLTSKCFLFTVHPKTVVFPTTFSGFFLGVYGFSCGQTP